MGGIGDPLADCQSLNALLIATTQALDTLLPLLRAQEEGLAAIELEVREGLRGAQAEAEAFEQEVAQSGAGVVGALRELDAFASATRDAATALGTAADGAGEAAGRDLDQAGDRLHARFEELVSEPFATLEHDLAEEQKEFAQATTDTEEARTTLSSAFATAAAGIGDDLERGQQSFEHATDVVDDLTEQVGASVDGFLPGFVLKHTVPVALHETLRTRTEYLKCCLEAW
jgi:hypothetical protein